MNEARIFFSEPKQTTHRRYEALRAIYMEDQPSRDVAEKFGYTIHTVQSLRRDFLKAVRQRSVSGDYFFVEPTLGRKESTEKDKLREEIIAQRKQNHSILDIQTTLHSHGNYVSHGLIYGILKEDGFSRLPKRSTLERSQARLENIKAPQSESINWDEDLIKPIVPREALVFCPSYPF